ncbi:MAG: hypothetical protein IJA65_00840 [Acholeplasmatales bacterium]|nr:hypothetical protein [Acholeplasmatales bacterium]
MKLRKKLFLSCAALAACAATLVSTTYAWYTSNSVVSASGIQGTTATSGSDLLLISDTGTAGTWSNSVTVADANAKATAMNPVEYTAVSGAQGTLKSWGGKGVSTNAAAAGADYIEFDIFVKASAQKDVYIEALTITNTTSTLPSKQILATAGGLAQTGTTTTYTVDALRTLQIEVLKETYVDAIKTTTTVDLLDPEGIITFKDDSIGTLGINATGENTKFNAHEYLNEVTGNTIAVDSEGTTGKKLSTTEGSNYVLCTTPVGQDVAKESYVKLTFRAYLNGWDWACFDACQGQTFTIAMTLTCDTTGKSVLKVPASV